MGVRQPVGHRWLWPVALAVLVLLPLPAERAKASCAAPYLFVNKVQRETVISAGTDITVSGRAFVRGCQDAIAVNAFGCESRSGEPESPMQDVALVLRQDERRWHLGRADASSVEANRLGHITWNVRIPTRLEPERAVFVADIPPYGRDALDARLPVTVRVRAIR